MARPKMGGSEKRVKCTVYVAPKVVEYIERVYGSLGACLEVVAGVEEEPSKQVAEEVGEKPSEAVVEESGYVAVCGKACRFHRIGGWRDGVLYSKTGFVKGCKHCQEANQ